MSVEGQRVKNPGHNDSIDKSSSPNTNSTSQNRNSIKSPDSQRV